MTFNPLAVDFAVLALCLAVWTDCIAARLASLAAFIVFKACLFWRDACVFAFSDAMGEAFTTRGAVLTERFLASFTLCSACGFSLIRFSAGDRPLFPCFSPALADIPCWSFSCPRGLVDSSLWAFLRSFTFSRVFTASFLPPRYAVEALSFPIRDSTRSMRFPAYSTADSSPVCASIRSVSILDFSFVSSMAERTSSFGSLEAGFRIFGFLSRTFSFISFNHTPPVLFR